MERFIKKNLFLVGALGISALGVLVLLVLSVMQYFEMSESIEKTEELKERRDKLIRQRIPAVRENIGKLQEDIDGFSKLEEQVKIYFGQPLYPALEKFCDSLSWGKSSKELQSLQKKFENIPLVRKEIAKLNGQNGQSKLTLSKLRALQTSFREEFLAIEANFREKLQAIEQEESAIGKRQQENKAKKSDQKRLKKLQEERDKLAKAKEDKLKKFKKDADDFEKLKSQWDKLYITPEKLRAQFAEFFKNDDNLNEKSNRQQVCRNFRDTQSKLPEADRLWNNDRWEEAMDIFIKEAQQTIEEKISDHNYEEIFLSSLGMPRNLGDSDDSMRVYRSDMQKRVGEMFKNDKSEIDVLGINFFVQRTVSAVKSNKDFNDNKDRVVSAKESSRQAGDSSNTAASGEGAAEKKIATKADEIRHWEIIADLTRRLCQAKVSSIEEITYSDLAGKENGSCSFYTYTLTVTGSEQSVRNLLNLLHNAYKEHRVYVVRNISVAKQEDQIQDIIDVANKRIGNTVEENNTLSTSDSTSGNQNKVAVAVDYYQEVDRYQECVAGRSNTVTATIVFDYVVYNVTVKK